MRAADADDALRPSERAMADAKRNTGSFMRDPMRFPFRDVAGNGERNRNQPFFGGFAGAHAKGTSALGDVHLPLTVAPSRPLNEQADCGFTFAQASRASRGGRPAWFPCPAGADCAIEKLCSEAAETLSARTVEMLSAPRMTATKVVAIRIFRLPRMRGTLDLKIGIFRFAADCARIALSFSMNILRLLYWR